MTRTVLLDLDGTLIDSAIGITRCVAHALQRMDIPVPDESALRRWIGPPLRESFGPLFGFDPQRTEQAVAFYRERFDDLGWKEHAIYPGVAEAIAALQRDGARLAVVTAKNEVHAERIVRHFDFAEAFETVSGASMDGRISHKPQLIAQALQRMELRASQCLMVGDRHMDIEGAKHHAMPGIGVLWGFGEEAELREAGADALIAHPRELAALPTRFP